MTDVQEQASQFVADEDPQQQDNGPVVETLDERRQRSREAVLVLPGQGLSPANMGEYVTMAQGVCKPDNIFLKPELRANIPVVIGLIDLAQRSRLSFYLLAMKAYVQKGVLCFESQAFNALARDHLDGGLKPEWQGEDLERYVIVRGKLKGDSYEYVHRSPVLGKLHPGYSYKEINGERLQFVKGSQLWDRKPDVQLFYDTSRDWIRMFCAHAVLGAYTLEEVMDENFVDVTPRPTLAERLAFNQRPEQREGFRPHVVSKSLDEAGADQRTEEGIARTPIHAEFTEEEVRPPRRVDTRRRKPMAKRPGKPAGAVKGRAKPKPQAKAKPHPRPAPPRQEAFLPLEAEAYVTDAMAWIAAAADPDQAERRWESEYDERNTIELSEEDRNRLRQMLDERCAQLRSTQ